MGKCKDRGVQTWQTAGEAGLLSVVPARLEEAHAGSTFANASWRQQGVKHVLRDEQELSRCRKMTDGTGKATEQKTGNPHAGQRLCILSFWCVEIGYLFPSIFCLKGLMKCIRKQCHLAMCVT